MKCIYCGIEISSYNKTNEHVIPQWIINKLGIKKQQLQFNFLSKNLDKVKITKPVPHTLTYKVCSSCNNGWLHDIDNLCKDFLTHFIDDNLSYNDLNEKNITYLKILIYKIYLNFIATSLKNFSEDKTFLHRDFFIKRYFPENIDLYATDLLAEEFFCISHLDHWRSQIFSMYQLNKSLSYSNSGSPLRFKFYLQLGKVAFVLCSTGENNNRILYDYKNLIPISVSKNSQPVLFDFGGLINPLVPDNMANKILYNLIRVEILI
ncbi:hypothetical protein GHT20_011420 [Acinetobacter baumannii]|uniref:hypothetical protein n=1 Tax=Acinetobacter baumannii TaxID=470 RepID=UPI00146151BB|nr:hypothetical protein [Acinetobacter baumannii]MBJ9498021.1 hypothetical protein [Acinetobacter baumannii]MBJ9546014.1 hypothetical protein [Acinetobacter baumannii]NMR38309.1 hypothetical protein [Acinetobacter baumannii]HAV5606144.1 hypothetical protein [Acinetobacter baumannii]HAV5636958.1 hypothetical protein [Acinetobacter baumannii]